MPNVCVCGICLCVCENTCQYLCLWRPEGDSTPSTAVPGLYVSSEHPHSDGHACMVRTLPSNHLPSPGSSSVPSVQMSQKRPALTEPSIQPFIVSLEVSVSQLMESPWERPSLGFVPIHGILVAISGRSHRKQWGQGKLVTQAPFSLHLIVVLTSLGLSVRLSMTPLNHYPLRGGLLSTPAVWPWDHCSGMACDSSCTG